MMTNSRETGRRAENWARSYLEQQGLTVIEENYATKFGELDLIAREGQRIVFVEVRYRKNSKFGAPYETINETKQRRIVRTAQHFLQAKNLYERVPVRFDIISITFDESEPIIEWFKNAIESS